MTNEIQFQIPELALENGTGSLVQILSEIVSKHQGANAQKLDLLRRQHESKDRSAKLNALLELLSKDVLQIKNSDLSSSAVEKIQEEIQVVMELLRLGFAIRPNEAASMLLGGDNQRFDWYQPTAYIFENN